MWYATSCWWLLGSICFFFFCEGGLLQMACQQIGVHNNMKFDCSMFWLGEFCFFNDFVRKLEHERLSTRLFHVFQVWEISD